MKKRWVLTFLFHIPFAAALDITGTLSNVWNRILGVGSLDFLGVSGGEGVVALVRILIWILLFTAFFAVMVTFQKIGDKTLFGFLSKTQAGVIAAVVATIATVFLPPAALLATGTGWATAIALLLIGGPIVGLAYLLYKIPGKGKDTKLTIFVKLVLCFVLFWILSAMNNYVRQF